MKTNSTQSCFSVQLCRTLLLLPLLLSSVAVCAETATPPESAVTPLPTGACPLNSGGPSLLDTEWRLLSVYGNKVPSELVISMKVGELALTGSGGCNEYEADFKRVGHTGFMITEVDKGRAGCPILRPGAGQQTINVGDWEGAYLRTLQRAGSVETIGNTLHFYNRSGEPSVVFGKKFGGTDADSPAVEPPAEEKPATTTN
ncbi:META domain-containing protein [Thiothrix subterranea]|uniref:META domain-containing protein n=1 Tax=Thiothrix subterranea TaxID=2735563 RepID=UPI00192C1D08|nr:META domain-containing protein [Thiothrix subterranea]QQZ30615.1 META domain-containing protein [Thiothrix subterranea]